MRSPAPARRRTCRRHPWARWRSARFPSELRHSCGTSPPDARVERSWRHCGDAPARWRFRRTKLLINRDLTRVMAAGTVLGGRLAISHCIPMTYGHTWWTRSQGVRTAWHLPIEVALVETAPAPAYQQISTRARQLRRRGLSYLQIARALGVTDKTVAKAIARMAGGV